jgi:hypothetical protein
MREQVRVKQLEAARQVTKTVSQTTGEATAGVAATDMTQP